MAHSAACARPKRLLIWYSCLVVFLVHIFQGISYGQEGIKYEMAIKGVEERGLRKELEAISKTRQLKNRPPPVIDFLRRRVENDIPRFTELLRSRGYYDATIDFEIEEQKKPSKVTFHISPGRVYPLRSVEVVFEDHDPELQRKFPSLENLGIKMDVPAHSATILDDQKTIINALGKIGYPFPKVSDRRIVVDHKAQDVTVTFHIDPGPSARFGSTSITGLESVKKAFVSSKIPWQQGEKYNSESVAELQQRLIASRLFSLVRITYAEELTADGLLPVTVELKERKHRTIRAGADYTTDQGPGTKFSWEDRNLQGSGERLRVVVTASQIALGVESFFQKPDFLRKDQSLVATFKLGREDTDAYTSDNTGASLLLERELTKGMKVGTGLGFRLATIEQLGEEQNFALVSVPSHFNWDTSDNLLDPTRGGRLVFQLTPYYDVSGSNIGFVKTYASYSRYVKLLEKPSILFAGRVAAGSISGADRDELPADQRFYGGGGGSIRGYPFQKASPLRDDEPIGGSSILELSAEFRFKVTENIGFVTFLDGGSAFESTYPDLSQDLRWGAGAGIRYFTPVGPLRLDIGFPLNPGDGVDDSYQIYVGIGQGF